MHARPINADTEYVNEVSAAAGDALDTVDSG